VEGHHAGRAPGVSTYEVCLYPCARAETGDLAEAQEQSFRSLGGAPHPIIDHLGKGKAIEEVEDGLVEAPPLLHAVFRLNLRNLHIAHELLTDLLKSSVARHGARISQAYMRGL
jgi:hypothetical protein